MIDNRPVSKPLLAYTVARLDRLVSKLLTQQLKTIDITLSQYTALSVLAAKGSLSNAQLAERSFITPQSANKILQDLLQAGLIERHADPSHGRIILMTLTEQGQHTLAQCHQLALEVEQKMLQHMDIHLVNLIQSSLEKMTKNLKD